MPRRNAEAWRQYDVAGLVGTDYSGVPTGTGSDITLEESQIETYTATLKEKGAWAEDDECDGRLVYINGRFAPSLSKTSNFAKNLIGGDITDDDMIEKLNRLPDGFTDRLAADVPSGETDVLTSFKTLSGPDHNVGEPTSQFSINNQQGTACFVALNSVRAGSIAHIDIPEGAESKPIIIVNAITADGGLEGGEEGQGVSMHPRTLATAGDNSKVSIIQSAIDLDDIEGDNTNAKFVNGVTQIFVEGGAKVQHSYIEETGGLVTSGVENQSDEEVTPRDIEAKRKALKDTHFEMIDVHVTGDDGSYEGTVLGIGGNGRSRIAVCMSLLRPRSHAGIKGFSLAGGAQRTDMRTNIHHIASGTTSAQAQKNMIGGRATGTFKGRIRVEQSAQQTDSEQLARTILLSDRARVWALPSLEIIADDVMCTHGATVSDLSEEELFYLRARGVDRTTARNILMYGFVDEISSGIDDLMQGHKDDPNALKNRVIKRLQNIVPEGDKILVGGEFQSV
jgi:Fe-S cluster assembly scaffold protein SufB